MAKGKKSLLETKNLPIIETSIEEGQIPYFVIDDEWGISCDERQEILVKKKNANRTIKDENGNEDHIEQYIMWESVCYPHTFTNAMNIYADKKGKIAKNKLNKSKDYNDLINIQNEIKTTIAKALDFNGINKDFLAIESILDERAKLEEELGTLKQVKEQVIKESANLLDLIKEKRTIIISNTEQKKHRVKEEE